MCDFAKVNYLSIIDEIEHWMPIQDNIYDIKYDIDNVEDMRKLELHKTQI